jgi:WD40 repeat protein
VEALGFLPDGRHIVSGDIDGALRLWSIATGRQLAANDQAHTAAIQSLAASSDGDLASVDAAGRLCLWRVSGAQLSLSSRISHAKDDSLWSVAFSPDGKSLALAGDDGRIRLVSRPSGRLLADFRGHAGAVYEVSFSPDGSTLASAGRDSVVRLWEIRSRRELRAWSEPEVLADGVCFSPDGRWVAASDYRGHVFVWNAHTGEAYRRFEGDSESVTALSFSPDGRTLAAASYDIRLFDVKAGAPRFVFVGHRQAVNSVVFSPDGRRLASGGRSGPVLVWSPGDGKLLRKLPHVGRAVTSLSFSPDGRRLAAGISFRTMHIWDTRTYATLYRLKAPGMENRWREHVAYSPDGGLLAWCGVFGPLRLLSADDHVLKREVLPTSGEVNSLAFANDGRRLCMGVSGFGVRIIDVRNGADLRVVAKGQHGVRAVAWSPDGRYIAAAGPKHGIRVWSARSGALHRVCHSGRYHRAIAFSQGSGLVAAGSDDGSIVLWRLSSGQLVETLGGHSGEVRSVAFSPAGRVLASSGVDTTVLVWTLAHIGEK